MWWAAPLALMMTTIQLLIIARHPEPAVTEPDAVHKPRYAALIRPGSVLVALTLTMLGSWVISSQLPTQLQPAWLVWGSAAMVLVGVDAATTWLPARAAVFAELCLSLAIIAGALLAAEPTARILLGAFAGALGAGGLFWLVWRFGRALGFGDVRLAAMMGALTGLSTARLWYMALLAGALAALAWGLGTRAWRRRRPSPLGKAFAYGPGLWLGPWLAWAWLGFG